MLGVDRGVDRLRYGQQELVEREYALERAAGAEGAACGAVGGQGQQAAALLDPGGEGGRGQQLRARVAAPGVGGGTCSSSSARWFWPAKSNRRSAATPTTLPSGSVASRRVCGCPDLPW
ncbi:hypothetical protein [Streptomyces globisporus]|uniref:hypothetical protein n=1 Tax=Streptomyces globisporus TaxID=1908 RepID=UPI0004C5F1D1|nr:hypothetical protein [Streptomyces globisporus]